jgi:hypothetical protein
MKQFKLFFGLFALAIVISSCEKNHICECVTFIDEEEQPKIENLHAIEDLKKKAAIKECNLLDSTEVDIDFVRTITNCELQ